MRWGCLFAVLLLTMPDGTPVWVQPGSLMLRNASDEPQDGCAIGARTVVRVQGAVFCVKETAQQIIDKLGDAIRERRER